MVLPDKDKEGSSGKIIKSNITDNESAKMVSSHGVIQGYNGIAVAVADSKNQVIVNAVAYGDGNDQNVLKDVIEKTKEELKAIDKNEKDIKKIKFLTDSCLNLPPQRGLKAKTKSKFLFISATEVTEHTEKKQYFSVPSVFSVANFHFFCAKYILALGILNSILPELSNSKSPPAEPEVYQ